jgi:hypothetical protein
MFKMDDIINMQKTNIMFIIAGLLISLFLAVFISPFASSSPDGLEKVAEEQGFISLSEEEGVAVWESSPMPDYNVPGVKDNFFTKGLAGFAGVGIIFIVGFVFARFLSKKRKLF